jgi:large-conductance mechanosensitive channel
VITVDLKHEFLSYIFFYDRVFNFLLVEILIFMLSTSRRKLARTLTRSMSTPRVFGLLLFIILV